MSIDLSQVSTNTEEVKTYKVIETFNYGVDIARAEYLVTINNELASPVLITFVTESNGPNKKSGVTKIPQKFIKDLQGIPQECHGLPFPLLLKLAHQIKDKEGTSVLEPQKKLIL